MLKLCADIFLDILQITMFTSTLNTITKEDTAQLDKESITCIDLPNCTTIGEDAFNEFINLQDVSVPSVVSIGANAFGRCINLSNIYAPECKEVSECAFDSCIRLKSVYLPKCESIGQRAFNCCGSVQMMSFPECQEVKSGAFKGCRGLSNINLGKVERLHMDMFGDCVNLIRVDAPECIHIEVSKEFPVIDWNVSPLCPILHMWTTQNSSIDLLKIVDDYAQNSIMHPSDNDVVHVATHIDWLLRTEFSKSHVYHSVAVYSPCSYPSYAFIPDCHADVFILCGKFQCHRHSYIPQLILQNADFKCRNNVNIGSIITNDTTFELDNSYVKSIIAPRCTTLKISVLGNLQTILAEQTTKLILNTHNDFPRFPQCDFPQLKYLVLKDSSYAIDCTTYNPYLYHMLRHKVLYSPEKFEYDDFKIISPCKLKSSSIPEMSDYVYTSSKLLWTNFTREERTLFLTYFAQYVKDIRNDNAYELAIQVASNILNGSENAYLNVLWDEAQQWYLADFMTLVNAMLTD